jgi:hypothetical protein
MHADGWTGLDDHRRLGLGRIVRSLPDQTSTGARAEDPHHPRTASRSRRRLRIAAEYEREKREIRRAEMMQHVKTALIILAIVGLVLGKLYWEVQAATAVM